MTRYALYYTPPPAGPLAELGRLWFADPAVAALTAGPRVYGFHATLKAPFRLTEGRREDELLAALARFCEATPPAAVGRLALADLAGFLALVPERQDPAVERLAADCVTAFDRFRAPPEESELARRRAAGLSERQEANLARWGYPYVFEDFHFHMTLSRRLEPGEAAAARARLAPLAAPALAEPAVVEALTLAVQPAEGEAFEVRRRLPLAG